MTQIDRLFQQIRMELGSDFIATYLVKMDDSSIAFAESATEAGFDSRAASNYFASVMKLAIEISEQLELGKMDDNLVLTDKAYIFSRLLGDSSYYWGLVVNRTAPLGAVRIVMNEYAVNLLEITSIR